MSARFTIIHKDDAEKNGKWSLLRRSLNLTSFGMNMVTLQPGESIKEHDEKDRNQEEVFITIKGNLVMLIDGKKYHMPEGTYVRVDVEPRRNVMNESDSVAELLIVSAPRTSGYMPMDWA